MPIYNNYFTKSSSQSVGSIEREVAFINLPDQAIGINCNKK